MCALTKPAGVTGAIRRNSRAVHQAIRPVLQQDDVLQGDVSRANQVQMKFLVVTRLAKRIQLAINVGASVGSEWLFAAFIARAPCRGQAVVHVRVDQLQTAPTVRQRRPFAAGAEIYFVRQVAHRVHQPEQFPFFAEPPLKVTHHRQFSINLLQPGSVTSHN